MALNCDSAFCWDDGNLILNHRLTDLVKCRGGRSAAIALPIMFGNLIAGTTRAKTPQAAQ